MHEPVVRLVVINCAVQPAGDLLTPTVDEPRPMISVAQQVVPERQPVRSAGFTVVEQTIDEPFALEPLRIELKIRQLFGSGRQPDQVKKDPTCENPFGNECLC